MVASPPVMSVSSSERVMPATYGLTTSGASVWPMNTLAATDSVSAPLVRISGIISRAISATTNCSTRRWYSTAESAEAKMTIGRPVNAKMRPSGNTSPSASGSASTPNTSRVPASVKLNIRIAAAASAENSSNPGRTPPISRRRISTASSSCRPKPQATVRQRMARMSAEQATRAAMKQGMPTSARTRPGSTSCSSRTTTAPSSAAPANRARSRRDSAPGSGRPAAASVRMGPLTVYCRGCAVKARCS